MAMEGPLVFGVGLGHVGLDPDLNGSTNRRTWNTTEEIRKGENNTEA